MAQNPTEKTNGRLGLTDRQVEALPHIAAASTLSEGARLAGISRTTLYRWMADDEFRRALESTRAEAADLVRSELEGLMLKATMVLADSLEDPAPNVRLRAASATLSLGIKALDIKELHTRIDHVSDVLALLRKKRPAFPFFNPAGGS